MREVEISDTLGHIGRLIDEIGADEEIILTREGRGIAKLTPMPRRGQSIRLGLARGRMRVPDGFDDPLPADLLDLFCYGPLFPDDPPLRRPETSELKQSGDGEE